MKHAALAIAVIIGTSLVSPAGAQSSMHLGLGAGAAIPVGKLDGNYSTGASGLATLSMGAQESPLGLRIDYQYAGFNGKVAADTRVPDIHINSLTANLVVAFRVGYAKPYLIGGAGWYPLRLPGATKRENDFGVNGGAGVAFPLPYTGIGAFIEARYHDVNRSATTPYTSIHYIPVTFGLMF
jgi:hypothetical protein